MIRRQRRPRSVQSGTVCGSSHELAMSQERRRCGESRAASVMPLCWASLSCRALGARHAQKECSRSSKVLRPAEGSSGRRPASGRRGAETDDARTRGLGLRHKSQEAVEQRGAVHCGEGDPRAGTKMPHPILRVDALEPRVPPMWNSERDAATGATHSQRLPVVAKAYCVM